MSYQAVIYDCDGVMFDSFEANLAFYERIMTGMECRLDRQDAATMKILHTYSHRHVLAHLFPDEQQQNRSIALASALDYRELIPLMRMEEGFRETLEYLLPRYRLAVCTNRSISMEAVLDDFDLSRYFHCVMTASKVSNPKPHPEPLLKVLDEFGITPEQALFVGDSVLDSQSAAAAGVPFLAYKADLPGLGRIDHHGDILTFLERN